MSNYPQFTLEDFRVSPGIQKQEDLQLGQAMAGSLGVRAGEFRA
jgi:hypothetical protein